MAKVTITLEDDGDRVNVNISFDPPPRADAEMTGAQAYAMLMVRKATQEAADNEEEEED